eukprot:TRINITY_DN4410_c0_g2_i2.p2 TRINITY_DN4410_c0_g2~~TRINITY_DN4410_c0_g2_i2.p2  ORF type:complete len:153 (+),score=37.86 TRINITY_DN4410_c0_g2_i2:134-592(+)
MLRSLVGSEMCIRDRSTGDSIVNGGGDTEVEVGVECGDLVENWLCDILRTHPHTPDSALNPLAKNNPGATCEIWMGIVLVVVLTSTPPSTLRMGEVPIFEPNVTERETISIDGRFTITDITSCLLYTSDAADEEDSVDLGGRRIIKKKKKID